MAFLPGTSTDSNLSSHGGMSRRPRACTFRVILSLDKKTTTVAAHQRIGTACLAFEVRLHRAQRPLAYGGPAPRVNRSSSLAGPSARFVFGGLLGLQQTERRMFTAPSPRGPRTKQEEGDP